MIEVGVILAVIVALVRGGKLERLADLELKGLPFVWVALGMRIAVGFLESRGFGYASWLQVLAYVLFLSVVWLNLSLPGMNLFGLGSMLNFVVIVANGGTMPVSAEAIASAIVTTVPTGTHSLLTSSTRLWFLADIIPVNYPLMQGGMVLSFGDLFIVLGVFILIQQRMLQRTPALVPVKK